MYRALYRKWRPQRFEDVVAQRGIVTALRNQIASGHAYLFTGVRGTGKTTCAKIFAKAVNCLHPHNGDPCGECEICKGIDNGSILDVVEMDAASNNGVDDIRDLRDETAYTPSACHYKVYIIDEVHMLSTAAFNALLKTLEEPPAHSPRPRSKKSRPPSSPAASGTISPASGRKTSPSGSSISPAKRA